MKVCEPCRDRSNGCRERMHQLEVVRESGVTPDELSFDQRSFAFALLALTCLAAPALWRRPRPLRPQTIALPRSPCRSLLRRFRSRRPCSESPVRSGRRRFPASPCLPNLSPSITRALPTATVSPAPPLPASIAMLRAASAASPSSPCPECRQASQPPSSSPSWITSLASAMFSIRRRWSRIAMS